MHGQESLRLPGRETPQPDRFIGCREAALGQEFFDIANAHTETVIQPDGVADDLGRKRYPW